MRSAKAFQAIDYFPGIERNDDNRPTKTYSGHDKYGFS
jgi:hypothetical protein